MNEKNLTEMTLSELAEAYNVLAAEADLPLVKKFSDKKTAIRRVSDMQHTIKTIRASHEELVKLPADPNEDVLPNGQTKKEYVDEQNRMKEFYGADGSKVDINDEEIKVQEKKLTTKKDVNEVKVPRVTKSGIIRKMFEESGLTGVHADNLSEASGHDLKNVGIAMNILANADRTKNPIKFVKVGKVYFLPEHAPQA
jgi:hypothetical protein